jgi:hypothetical protein
VKKCPFVVAKMISRNFRVLGLLVHSEIETKANSSSRGQKDFICREEKEKAAWEHASGPRNPWSCGSGWKLGFIAFFFLNCPKAEISLWCKQMFPGKKCLPG